MSVFADEDLFKDFEEDEEESESDEEIEEANTRYQQEYNELIRENKRIKETLKRENEELKKTLRILTRPMNIKIKDPVSDGPIAHVIMFNNILARKYRQKIQDFFYDLSTRKVSGDDSEEVTELQSTYLQYLAPEEKPRKVSSHRAEATVKAFQAFSSVQVYRKFFIDHLGEPLLLQDPSVSDWFQPEYDEIVSSPLDGDPDNGQCTQRKRPQRICFNCGGDDHQMKDCEKARDHRAVNERRQKFMEEVAKCHDGSPQIRFGGQRYHEEEEDAESDKNRFADFKPGIISKNLQEALGISENDIPPYIYNMRIHGYPPGHLQNARMIDSGLELYHEQDNRTDNNREEYVPVNVEKIIGYPGYNIPPLPGQSDDFVLNNAPPMDEAHSKTVMCYYFEHRNNLHRSREAERKKQKEETKLVVNNDLNMEEIDMEMGDDDEDEDQVVESGNAITKTMEDEVEEGEVDDDGKSLTEDELNLERERLLKALDQENENQKDSDYRTIETQDQDYRIKPIIIDLTETTDSEREQKECEDNIQEECMKYDERDPKPMISEEKGADLFRDAAKRTVSSDTDYRMSTSVTVEQTDSPASPNGEIEDHTTIVESETISCLGEQNNNTEIDEPICSNEEEQKLPGREKFAKGITQFDAYYSESKSQGVYKKLKTLLEHSPRRKDK